MARNEKVRGNEQINLSFYWRAAFISNTISETMVEWKPHFKWGGNRKCWPVGSVLEGFAGVWFSVTFSVTGSDGVFETIFWRGVFWQWISCKKQMKR